MARKRDVPEQPLPTLEESYFDADGTLKVPKASLLRDFTLMNPELGRLTKVRTGPQKEGRKTRYQHRLTFDEFL